MRQVELIAILFSAE